MVWCNKVSGMMQLVLPWQLNLGSDCSLLHHNSTIITAHHLSIGFCLYWTRQGKVMEAFIDSQMSLPPGSPAFCHVFVKLTKLRSNRGWKRWGGCKENQEWAREGAEVEMELINAIAKGLQVTGRTVYQLQPDLRPGVKFWDVPRRL